MLVANLDVLGAKHGHLTLCMYISNSVWANLNDIIYVRNFDSAILFYIFSYNRRIRQIILVFGCDATLLKVTPNINLNVLTLVSAQILTLSQLRSEK